MHRRNSGGSRNRAALQDLLEEALWAARRGDLDALFEREKTLAPMNEALFHVFNLDIQGAIKRAADQKKTPLLVRAVVVQIILSIRLLLRECRGLEKGDAMLSRIRQAVLNYRVIEKDLAAMDADKAGKINALFQKIDAALPGDLASALPLTVQAETLLGSLSSPSPDKNQSPS